MNKKIRNKIRSRKWNKRAIEIAIIMSGFLILLSFVAIYSNNFFAYTEITTRTYSVMNVNESAIYKEVMSERDTINTIIYIGTTLSLVALWIGALLDDEK